MAVKSVYNFVPAPKEDEVFKPDWAEQVSHDIPFSDGESGEIELKITAETPIFIRNGHAEDQEENEFSHFMDENGEKKYFIPATSLKGMFRNVLEIISSSRMSKNLVDDNRYSFRDLSIGSLYMKSYKSQNVSGGWLKEIKNGRWVIEECDSIYHIHHSEVDKAIDTKFRKEFLNKNPEEKTAKYKYEQVSNSLCINFSTQMDEKGNASVFYNKEGSMSGTLVFTGQPGKRNESQNRRASGKVHEFVFTDKIVGELYVSEQQKRDFKFIYLDQDSSNISPDWKFWKEKIQTGNKMPVFYTKNGDKLIHFGLAFMYKLPYRNSIHEMQPIKNYKYGKDLSEVIFGKAQKSDSFKGRVYVGTAFSKNAVPEDKPRKEILGNPKASYFPFYLKQENIHNEGYTTYEDDGELRGFKRYPVRSSILEKEYSDNQLKNQKVFSSFIPIKSGAEFNLKIRFHNLRKVEIGALLSAITFHSNSSSCFHSLGGVKSLGYGKLKVSSFFLNSLKFEINEYLLALEEALGAETVKNRLKELLAMAGNTSDATLDYPVMNQDRKINDFVTYKKENQYLQNYSNMYPFEVFTLTEVKAQKLEKELKDKENAEKVKAQQEERELSISLGGSSDIKALENFIKQYPYNKHTPIFKRRLEKLYKDIKEDKAEKMKEQLSIEFSNTKFKDTKGVLNGYLKKNKHFEYSDEHKQQIIEQVRNCWKEDREAFYKKKKLANFPKYPWSDVIKWLGQNDAKALFDELTKKID